MSNSIAIPPLVLRLSRVDVINALLDVELLDIENTSEESIALLRTEYTVLTNEQLAFLYEVNCGLPQDVGLVFVEDIDVLRFSVVALRKEYTSDLSIYGPFFCFLCGESINCINDLCQEDALTHHAQDMHEEFLDFYPEYGPLDLFVELTKTKERDLSFLRAYLYSGTSQKEPVKGAASLLPRLPVCPQARLT